MNNNQKNNFTLSHNSYLGYWWQTTGIDTTAHKFYNCTRDARILTDLYVQMVHLKTRSYITGCSQFGIKRQFGIKTCTENNWKHSWQIESKFNLGCRRSLCNLLVAVEPSSESSVVTPQYQQAQPLHYSQTHPLTGSSLGAARARLLRAFCDCCRVE
jgi:hypothetical protein